VIRTLLALLLALLAGHAAAQGAPDPATQARLKDLSEKLRCLVCQNQSLADSNADLAVDLRREIEAQVKSGRSDAQIVEFMVQRYGDFVLYQPPLKASTLLLWLGPFLLLAAAATFLIVALRRRRPARDDPELDATQRQLVDRVLGGEPRDRQSP
jgi:cytochrome c-type biogenesis protein CcmH